MQVEYPYFSPGKSRNGSPMLSAGHGVLSTLVGGEHWHRARNRRTFTSASAATAAVVPIYSNTTQQFGLYNPPGSGRFFEIHEIAATYLDTTGAAGGYVLGIVGSASDLTVTAATAVAKYEALTDGVVAADSRGRPITAITTTAPALYRHLGANQLVLTATDATTAAFTNRYQFRGDLGIRPGTLIVFAGNIATLSKFCVSWTWSEEDE